jgi:hypothetical protein
MRDLVDLKQIFLIKFLVEKNGQYGFQSDAVLMT